MSTRPCSATPSASITPAVRPGFPSCSDQTPGSIVSFLSPVSHLWCKISSAVSFRNKYLKLLQRQEKETSGDFPPFLPAGAGSPAVQGCRGQLGEGGGDSAVARGPWMSPGLPRRQEKSPGPRPPHCLPPWAPIPARRHIPALLGVLSTPRSLSGHASLNMSRRVARHRECADHAHRPPWISRAARYHPQKPLCPLASPLAPAG